MSIVISLAIVAALCAAGYLGATAAGLDYLFAVVIPYAAIAVFLAGFVFRILKWACAPVPFNIATTCGQQKSLRWVRNNPLEAPHNVFGVIGRMALEVLCFRSLLRNVKHEFVSRENYEPKLAYKASIGLWIGALAFHYSFLIVFVRHYRFFTTDPQLLGAVNLLQSVDGFFQVLSPTLLVSGVVLPLALLFLLSRRLTNPQLRYISLVPDYFPLFLLLGIATTGILMRYSAWKVDIPAVKDLCMGLMRFHPVVPEGIGSIFYVHLLLVCALFIYFPFSKLMHMGGVFLSPTRNMIAASRMVRHENPWNHPVKVHTYEEYEDEFREKMVKAGLPVDKPLEVPAKES